MLHSQAMPRLNSYFYTKAFVAQGFNGSSKVIEFSSVWLLELPVSKKSQIFNNNKMVVKLNSRASSITGKILLALSLSLRKNHRKARKKPKKRRRKIRFMKWVKDEGLIKNNGERDRNNFCST